MATRKQPPKRRGATASRRQPSPKPARRLLRGWRVPGWLWGLAGLAAGFLLAQHQHGTAPWQLDDSPLAALLPRSAPPASAPEPEAPPAPSEPRMPTFEFYTLLPGSEVIVPRGDAPASTAAPPPLPAPAVEEALETSVATLIPANPADSARQAAEPAGAQQAISSDHRYMLQAASFRELHEAEQLRGRLRNFGLLAQVSEVEASGGETWHRVQVGPYDNDRELHRAQDLMATQGIDPLLIRLSN